MTENHLPPAFVGARLKVELESGDVATGTVSEVLDATGRVRVTYDDTTSAVLEPDDAWTVMAGKVDGDALPHGYRQIWAEHPIPPCPRCWACARRAAMEAHARGEHLASVELDGHGATVRNSYD